MHEIKKLKEKLIGELEGYAKLNDLSAANLEVIDKLAHATKNICKILDSADMENEKSERGMSYRGSSYTDSSYRGNSYDGGYSMRRGRDSMGRYSSGGYSRSGGADELAESIRDMMPDLPEEMQREAKKFLQKIEQ